MGGDGGHHRPQAALPPRHEHEQDGLTVGSANLNDRSFEYEGELNLAVVDRELVRGVRLDLWREHLGDRARLSGDIDRDVAEWRRCAAHNRLAAEGRPVRVHGQAFPFRPAGERPIIVGADVV